MPATFVCFKQLGYYLGLINPASPRLFSVPRCSDMAIATWATQLQEIKESDDVLTATLVDRDEKDALWAIYQLKWHISPPN
jgi:hypothetical protein